MTAQILPFAIPRPPKPLADENRGIDEVRAYIDTIRKRIRVAHRDPRMLVRESIRCFQVHLDVEGLPHRDAPSQDHSLRDLAFRVSVSEWADELRVISEYFPHWRHLALAAAALVNELDALDERIEGEVRRLVERTQSD